MQQPSKLDSLIQYCHAVHRQVDALTGRVDKLPSPEDWSIMEQALAAMLDEAATRAEEEDRLAEQEAAQRDDGPLGFLEEEEQEEGGQASSWGSRGDFACDARPAWPSRLHSLLTITRFEGYAAQSRMIAGGALLAAVSSSACKLLCSLQLIIVNELAAIVLQSKKKSKNRQTWSSLMNKMLSAMSLQWQSKRSHRMTQLVSNA